ncbi:MAG: efflux RND transporter permease subunit [Candidatus Paceibacterota bacterium]|jgi:HAE1 family hydrophobic/amphiphilic exporter-1
MKFTLSSWAIRNPIPPMVLFLILTVAGVVSYFKLPINNTPNVDIPIVSVAITQPGAAPTELEGQVTRRVESALTGVLGVKHVSSTITQSHSDTTVIFQLETDFDRALNDTRDAIAKLREELPGSILEPVISRVDSFGGPALTYSVEAPNLSPEALSEFIDDRLSRELLSLPGVAQLERKGGVDHEITITLNPARLESYNLTASDISRRLALITIDLPGGRITVGGTEHTLRTLGGANSVDKLKNLRIALDNNRMLRLSDLGEVTDGGAEARNITKLDGKPAVTFQLYRAKGASDVAMTEKVQAALKRLQADQPDIKFTELFSTAEETLTSFHATLSAFFEGTLLTIFVMYLFLRNGRATVLAAIAIPFSVIPTFLVMSWLDFSLNQVSLLAITLVTGVLVDDAIVEIENIHRHLDGGKRPYEAAMEAADEIGLAVVATTMVICAVFAPVSFLGGMVGQIFKQFGMTVAIAAFFSLLVARLLTPMLAAYLCKPHNEKAEALPTSKWTKRYHNLVEWTLDHRLKTLGIAGVILVGSFALIPFLQTGAMPQEETSQSQLVIEMPRGATIEATDKTAQDLMQMLRQRKEVAYVLTLIDERDGGVNKASLTVKLVPRSEREIGQREFEQALVPELHKFPDVRINFANNKGDKELNITLLSENPAELESTASTLERQMRALPELSSVTNSAAQPQPEIIITPDFEKLATLGLTVNQISDAIRIATIGDNEPQLAKFNDGNRQIPIRVRLPPADYPNLSVLENLKLPALNGTAVPIKAVAQVAYGIGPSVIERDDRQRKISIAANLNGVPLGTAVEKINKLPVLQNLPADIQRLDTGDVEMMQELFTGFLTAIGAGLMMVYAIQVLLYRDWLQPLTRMAALPLAIGGSFLALLLTGTAFNMPVAIGLLMLMGIADKNAILLVDYMIEKMRAGTPMREAIIEACLIRARPIIMTSSAMLAGMLPIAAGLGADSSFRAPMAIAVMGGLLSSTALSLIFVPILFSYVRDFESWLGIRYAIRHPADAPGPFER